LAKYPRDIELMQYPKSQQVVLNKDKLQKIFLASSPFNLLFAEYFKRRGDDRLEKYIFKMVESYMAETGYKPQDIIDQIEASYQAYLIESSENVGS